MRRVRSQFPGSVWRLFGVRKARVGLAGVAGLGLLAALLVPVLVSADSKVNVRNIGTPRAVASAGGGFYANAQKGVVVNQDGAGGVSAGSVYLADFNNNRIQQFDSSGGFVRAWGRDVVWEGEHNSSVNEQQTVTVNATGGFFTLGVVTAAAAADYSSGSTSVTVTPGFGTFRVGDTITQGVGVVGARIVGVSGNTLTLSTPATGNSGATTGSNIAATETVGATATGDLDGSTTVTNVVTSTGSFDVGQAISGTGIPAGTTITAVGSGTLTLSAAAAAGTGVALNSGISYNASASAVQDFLSGLPGVEANDITVSGGPGGTTPYTLTFAGGIFDGNDLANLATGATRLTGGAATAVVATPTTGGAFEICQATSTPQDFCKQGTANQVGGTAAAAVQQAAGSFFNIAGVAVDQDTGKVYVYDSTQRRVNVHSATGAFEGAFGWGVQNGAAAPQFCTTVTGCQAPAAAGAAAGQFAAGANALAVDPANGHVYVAASGNRRVEEFAPTFTGSAVTGVSFQRAFGWDVVPGGDTGLETCTTACQAGTAGNGAGQFTTSQPAALALDSTGAIYTVESTATCTTGTPCRVQRFNPSATSVSDFAPGELTFTSGSVRATQLTVDPTNDHLHVAQTVGASQVQVKELDTDGTLLFTSPPGSPLASSNASGVAIDPDNELTYVSGSAVYVLGPVPAPTAAMTPPVTNVTGTSATFSGTIEVPSPGGPGFETSYRFEYSPDGINWTNVPSSLVSVGNVAGSYSVTQTASGLKPNTNYSVRITACAGSCVTSAPIVFSTDAVGPSISLTFSQDVTQTTATLGAHVNPNSADTTYHFEWGTTTAYGNRVPATDRQIGDSDKPIIVIEAIAGLQTQTTYHYRVVATNATGTTYGPDRFETINECGLIQDRCLELVSPADPGRVSGAGDVVAIGPGVQSQVASDGSRVSYILAYGLPDSTVGGEVQYQSARGPSGWTSWQLTAPAVGPIVTDGTTGDPGSDVYLSDDLTCGFTVSNQALTANAPTQVIEAGGVNLFRRGSDGDYTVVTPEPANPRADPPASGFVDYYKVEGASPDCDRAFFRTNYRYDGVTTGTGAGPFGSINGPQTYMYEWRNGELAPATVVPSPSGLVPALDATPGWYNGAHHNAVSADGRRLFFTATSQQGADVGKKAVFLREGDDTIDVSQSENGTVNQGARYQDAAEDGSKVYFLANYGLTAAASNGPQTANCSLSGIGAIGAPCTLYEYDVQTGDLTDLTATTDPVNSNGPVVAGVLDVSDTGSHVYFAARAQLVDGEGKTYAQNIAGTGSYNLYVAHGAETDYVANVSAGDVTEAQLGPGLLAAPASTNGGPVWSSQSTPDGEALVFAATGNVTGFDGGDVMHVYRYSADSGGTACVSCRRDGKAPVGASTDRPLATRDNDSFANYMNEPRNISADGSRVFFRTADVLAVGAVEGNNNLYEWHDGQIALLATRVVYSGTPSIRFMGASVDGDSAVFSATGRFTPDDMSDRRSVYVARVGANPTEPSPTSPPACDPLVVGSCTDSGRTPSAPGIETETSGEGPVSPPSRSRLRVGVLTVAQRARLARGKGVELTVRASRPGLVAVVGRARIAGFNVSVVRASARATKAGMLRLPIRLSRPARSALRSTSRLRVGLRVSQAGTPAALVRTAIVIERPPERRDKQVKRVSRRASASATSNQGSR